MDIEEAAEEAGGAEKENKDPNKQRTIWPTPEWGIGHGDASDSISYFARARTPWQKRGGVERTVGPANDASTLDWLRSVEKQFVFAQYFAAPCSDDIKLRTVQNDTGDVFCTPDYSKKMLNVLMAVEKPTWMELPRTSLAQNVMLLNHCHDRKRDLVLEGPEGGLQGLASCVLWKLDFSDDQRTFDTDLLELAEVHLHAFHGCHELSLTLCVFARSQMIGEGLQLSSDMLIIPSVATNYTDVHLYNSGWRNKKQHGARFMTKQNSDAVQKGLPFRMSQDVDIFLLKRVAAYRAKQHGFTCNADGEPELEYGYDNPVIIPMTRALNEPSMENEPVSESDRQEQTKICTGLFRMFLYMDLVKGVDSSGDTRTVKISMILLQSNTPGTDPLVALKQIGEQNNKMSATMLDVLSHMKRVLLNDFSSNMSMREAFSTGTQREAARLCCEALLPYAVFKFASNYKLKHMHFGGMRMDVEDEEEMRVWSEYQDGVMRARLAHYSLVLDGVNIISRPGGIRQLNVPVEECGVDLYEGVHFRYIEIAVLDAAIDNAVMQANEDERPGIALGLYEWSRHLLSTGTHVFIADSRPWARNTGVLVELSLDAFPAFQKSRGKAGEDHHLVCRIPQLMKVAPVLEIYFNNRAESPDPMHIIWNGEQEIIPDLGFLVDEQNRLPVCVQVVREAMHELATTSVRDMLTSSDIRHEDLMQLYGNQAHRVHNALRNVRTKVGLYNQAHVSYNTLVSALKSTLSNMVTGELIHWAMAARSVFDLRTQSRQNQNTWIKDWRNFLDDIRKTGYDSGVLDETTMFAHYAAYTDKVLNLELSFQNNATVRRSWVLSYG